MRHGYSEGDEIYLVIAWVSAILFAAADCELHNLSPHFIFPCSSFQITVVMILRVYAMWSQSKRVIYTLFFIYVPQVIVSFVARGMYSPNTTNLSGMSQAKLEPKLKSHKCLIPPFSPVTVVQIMDLSFCNISFNDAQSFLLLLGATVLQFFFSVMLFILAVIPTLKESVVLYKATKQWQPNHYMQQLVKDGMLYFLAYVSILSVPFITITFSRPSYAQVPARKLTTLNF